MPTEPYKERRRPRGPFFSLVIFGTIVEPVCPPSRSIANSWNARTGSFFFSTTIHSGLYMRGLSGLKIFDTSCSGKLESFRYSIGTTVLNRYLYISIYPPPKIIDKTVNCKRAVSCKLGTLPKIWNLFSGTQSNKQKKLSLMQTFCTKTWGGLLCGQRLIKHLRAPYSIK